MPPGSRPRRPSVSRSPARRSRFPAAFARARPPPPIETPELFKRLAVSRPTASEVLPRRSAELPPRLRTGELPGGSDPDHHRYRHSAGDLPVPLHTRNPGMNVPPSHSQAFQLHRCRLRRQRSTSNSCPNYVPRSSVAMGTHGHGAPAFGVVPITARQPNRMPPARSACGNQCAWTAHRHTSCTGRPRPDGPQRKAPLRPPHPAVSLRSRSATAQTCRCPRPQPHRAISKNQHLPLALRIHSGRAE